MADNYVFPDMGEKAANELNKHLENGDFTQYQNSKSMAKALTKALRKTTKDKHLSVRVRQAGGKQHSEKDTENKKHKDRERQRQRNQGIAQVSRLADNIGYLDLRGFVTFNQGKSVIDASMALLTTADAMIIDLRKNGGGDPEMVQYLSSFFFQERLLLNSLYYRAGDVTQEYWTLKNVNGTKLPNIPLYILTSHYTFSAAEEFSYNMQTQKRATLIGETTGGGANPGGMFIINDHFEMFLSTGRAINPITKTNWEGVGVVPEIAVDADLALEKAIELATLSAEKVRDKARRTTSD
jgi:C-terminal processing protease CtpA/Prc